MLLQSAYDKASNAATGFQKGLRYVFQSACLVGKQVSAWQAKVHIQLYI